MEIFHNSYIRIIGSTLLVYVFIIIAIRIFGKKELAQLSVFDLVFILLISNAVQNAMVLGDNTLWGGLIAAAALFGLNWVLKFLEFRSKKFSKVLQGEALMLVYQGSINIEHMHQARITMDELEEPIREHGVAGVKDVDLAIFEVDGSISVLSHSFQKKSSRKRKAHKIVSKQN